MIAVLPVSLSADDAAPAMLRSNGLGVFLNGSRAPASVAVFPHDFVATQNDAMARIEAKGSTADIGPETMVQFDGDELVLDHGRLAVHTTIGLRVRVGCVTITPQETDAWTYYEVADGNGRVQVSAAKRNVYVLSREKNAKPGRESTSERALVREGEEKSRTERCGAAPDTPAGPGPILNSPWAIGAGVAAVTGLACFALCDRNGNPMSPTRP